ncbi:alpha/beta hydrolase [Cognatilysobacter bugurensis]|nr:alpha/beta fold hydrolase [Lysobacter bugurensis]
MRVTLGAVAIALALWVALCAWLFVQQRRLIYHPGFTRTPAASTDFSITRDGVVLRGWRVRADCADAIVYFGGNAETLLPMRERLRALFPHHALYLVAYRGYGASDGTPSETAIVGDARAVFDIVRRAHPKGTVTVIGRSLGAGVAARLASERAVDRLVLVTPFDRLSTVAQSHLPWAPARLLLRERYEAAAAVADLRTPVLVAVAGHDTVVPNASTRALIRALPRAPGVVELPGATHIDVVEAPAFNRALQSFVGPASSGCGGASAHADEALG